MIKTIPKKNKYTKAKWWSEEDLQIPEKRREWKRKGEKESSTHPNAEFQRIARRKKAFLTEQCQEMEKNNKMRKTREIFKKIRDKKRIFHEKMGTIKERRGMDLTEAEDVKKKWQGYIEELYKKGVKDSDNDVVTH